MDDITRALEELYRQRYGTFRDAMAGIADNRDAAREVVQEAFAVALRERRKYRGEGSLEAWVWRMRVPARAQAEAVEPPGRGGTAGAWDEAAGGDPTPAARRRLILFLRYFADLSYADIAAACEIEEGTVGAVLTQARSELEAILTVEEGTR